jgi:hypothetical protein
MDGTIATCSDARRWYWGHFTTVLEVREALRVEPALVLGPVVLAMALPFRGLVEHSSDRIEDVGGDAAGVTALQTVYYRNEWAMAPLSLGRPAPTLRAPRSPLTLPG